MKKLFLSQKCMGRCAKSSMLFFYLSRNWVLEGVRLWGHDLHTKLHNLNFGRHKIWKTSKGQPSVIGSLWPHVLNKKFFFTKTRKSQKNIFMNFTRFFSLYILLTKMWKISCENVNWQIYKCYFRNIIVASSSHRLCTHILISSTKFICSMNRILLSLRIEKKQ